jgi:ribosome-binding protein aMBF1 (putative translation factor)
MITGLQIRSARAALRWSVQHLAEAAGVGTQTIKRFEAADGIPRSRTQTLLDVKAALESAGIEFTGMPDDSPGIRLRSQKSG